MIANSEMAFHISGVGTIWWMLLDEIWCRTFLLFPAFFRIAEINFMILCVHEDVYWLWATIAEVVWQKPLSIKQGCLDMFKRWCICELRSFVDVFVHRCVQHLRCLWIVFMLWYYSDQCVCESHSPFMLRCVHRLRSLWFKLVQCRVHIWGVC